MRLGATILVLLSPTLARADEPPRMGDDAFALPVLADGGEVQLLSRGALEAISHPDVRVLGFAHVGFHDWELGVTVATPTTRLFAAADDELDGYVAGAESGTQGLCSGAHARGDAHGSHWSIVTVGGAPALRYWIDCDTKGPHGVDRSLDYVILQPGRDVLVHFMGNHEHAAEIERAAQRMLDGARVQRYRAPLFGKPRAFQIGYRVGRVLGPLLLLLSLAWAAMRLLRKR